MKIICTGVGGFVMSRASLHLLEVGHEVFGIENFSFGNRKNIPLELPFIEEDFNNSGSEFLNMFDVLLHGATSNIIYSQTHEIETYRTNAINTINLFSKFKGKIIYTSTASVYNNASVLPTKEDSEIHTVNAYDTSKRIAELYLQERGNYTTLRLSNLYGINQRPENPYCGVVAKMIDKAMKREPLRLHGDGKDTRDFTFVEDVVDAIVNTVESPALNTEINISTQVETSAYKLSEMICGELNQVHSIAYVDKRKIDCISRRCLDNSKAKELLGWTPKTTLEEGLKKTIEWQKNEEGSVHI